MSCYLSVFRHYWASLSNYLQDTSIEHAYLKVKNQRAQFRSVVGTKKENEKEYDHYLIFCRKRVNMKGVF